MRSRVMPYLLAAVMAAGFLALSVSAKSVYGAPVPAAVQRWLPTVERHIVAVWGDDRWVALHGAVIERESSGRPEVGSIAGAVGLMQIMPATFRELRQQYPGHGTDRRNPDTSIALGARYLHRLHRPYRSLSDCQAWRRALAAYNCGPGCTARRIRQHGASWARYLPRETRHYIAVIPERVPVFIAADWPGVTVC